MAIVNKDNLYRVSWMNSSYIKTPFSIIYGDEISKDKRCFYVGISNAQSIGFITEKTLGYYHKLIIDKKVHLLLSCEHESFVDIIEEIYIKLIIGLGIPESQIIYVAGTTDVLPYLEDVCIKYKKEKITLYYFSALENYMHVRLGIKTQDSNRVKEKRFLCLNRRWRLHRPFLVGLLYSKQLLKHGFVSLGESDDNLSWDKVIPHIIDAHKQFPCDETLKIFQTYQNDIRQIPKLYLDTDNLVEDKVWFDDKLTPFYENSNFSVVTETNYFSSIRFLTEKIFKPIVYKHPFIVASAPHTLSMLKTLGYKTFSPYIDESYDQEENHCKRMLMILNEIEKLCNMTDVQFKMFLDAIQPILNYNYNLLESKKSVRDYIYKLT